MSELYRSGAESGSETSEPATETNPAAPAEHEPAPDTTVSQYEEDAAIEARLPEAGLPTRAEARAAALRADADDEVASLQDLGAAEEWPTSGEQTRLHQTYLDWRQEAPAGQERGSNVVGDKPVRSPGDGRDIPPTGEELLEGETRKRSRLDGLRHEWEKDEVLDGLHSEAEQDTSTIQSILEARPPEGHPVQVVPDHPNMAPVTPIGIEAGSIATAGLMVGVVVVEAGRRFHDMVRRRRGAGHAR